MTITGPFHLVGRQRTLSMLSAIEPNKDLTLGTPLEDMQSAVQRVTVIQRPIIRFRLGIIGRLILLLAIVGVIAAFIFSRLYLSGSDDVIISPPATPVDFSAEQLGTDQILLRWRAVSGATGYSVYAVGDAGNALTSPSTSGSSGGTSQSISFSSPVVFMPASVGAGGGTGSPSPSTSPSPDSSTSTPSPSASSPSSTVYNYDIESPSCGDCTHVGDVPSGTARFVVTKTTLGQQNCYRLLATAGKTQSLYTPQMCVLMPTAAEIEDATSGASGGSGGDGSSEAAATAPCPPFEPMADKLSDTALALTWMLPSETPEGQEVVACDKNAKVTGFDIQRQILSGWSSVSPGPAAGDSALEVQDLEPATKYCFRMRSKAGDQISAYSDTFCKKTKKSSASKSTTLTPVPANPNFVASPKPTSSASADAGAASDTDPDTASPAPSPSATPSESAAASGDAAAGAVVESSPTPSPSASSMWSEPNGTDTALEVIGVAEGEVVAEEAGGVAGVADGEGDWPSVGLVEGDGDGLLGVGAIGHAAIEQITGSELLVEEHVRNRHLTEVRGERVRVREAGPVVRDDVELNAGGFYFRELQDGCVVAEVRDEVQFEFLGRLLDVLALLFCYLRCGWATGRRLDPEKATARPGCLRRLSHRWTTGPTRRRGGCRTCRWTGRRTDGRTDRRSRRWISRWACGGCR